MAEMTLKEALESLDPDRDEDWTGDGAPRLDRLTILMGEPAKRGQVTEQFPSFTRDNWRAQRDVGEVPEPQAEPSEEPVEPQEEPPADDGWPARRAALEAAIAEAQKKRDEADTELHEANMRLQREVEEYERTRPRNSNQTEIMRAIKRSVESRGARADEIRQESLRRASMSPIDRAMAPRRSRGMNRPAYPKS